MTFIGESQVRVSVSTPELVRGNRQSTGPVRPGRARPIAGAAISSRVAADCRRTTVLRVQLVAHPGDQLTPPKRPARGCKKAITRGTRLPAAPCTRFSAFPMSRARARPLRGGLAVGQSTPPSGVRPDEILTPATDLLARRAPSRSRGAGGAEEARMRSVRATLTYGSPAWPAIRTLFTCWVPISTRRMRTGTQRT